MHKKKRSESVGGGEMIITFYKPARMLKHKLRTESWEVALRCRCQLPSALQTIQRPAAVLLSPDIYTAEPNRAGELHRRQLIRARPNPGLTDSPVPSSDFCEWPDFRTSSNRASSRNGGEAARRAANTAPRTASGRRPRQLSMNSTPSNSHHRRA